MHSRWSVVAVLVSGAATAAPVPKVPKSPTLYREVSYSSFEQGGGQRIQQFDPAKGTLISARAEATGNATFVLTNKTPLTQPTPYAFKAGYYVYFGPGSAHLFVNGSTTFAPYKNDYVVTATGSSSASEPVPGNALAALRGKGTLAISFSSDLPNPPPPGVPPGTFTPTKLGGSLKITYVYYPALQLPKNLPPKKP